MAPEVCACLDQAKMLREPCSVTVVVVIARLTVSFTRNIFVSEHKVIIVGLDNAGKTTILYQL